MATGVAGDTSLMWAEFAGRLRAFVARRVPPGIEPDDVVQEVFLRVMRHLPSLREADRIEAWLFQIARNTLHDAMRVRQRRDGRTDTLEIDLPDETDTEDVRAAEAELAPCLTPMVARLSEPYRQAIELTSVHGLTQADAAKRAGVSVSGMKSRVQRAREQLKGMLLRCCEVDVDRRRGVADFHMRESASCATSSDRPTSSSGCGVGACSPRR
jgi:RNA polymerase sigma-70 factor (ECF subfamily)